MTYKDPEITKHTSKQQNSVHRTNLLSLPEKGANFATIWLKCLTGTKRNQFQNLLLDIGRGYVEKVLFLRRIMLQI